MIVQRCLETGLLINCTHDTVLRMLPAMNIPQETGRRHGHPGRGLGDGTQR